MKRLGNSVNSINITIGKLFLPAVTAITNKVAAFAAVLQDIAASPIGAFLLKLTAGIGLGVLAIAGLAGAIALASVYIPAFLAGLATLGTAVAALAWPVTLVIGVVAAFTLIWRKNIGGIADFIRDKFAKINLVIRGVTAVFRTLKDGVGEIRGELAEKIEANGLVGVITTIGKLFYRVYQFVSGFFSGLKEGFGDIFASLAPVVTFVKTVTAPVVKLLSYIGQLIGRLAGAGAATNASGWAAFGKVIGTVVLLPFRLLAFAIGKVFTVFTIGAKIIGFFINILVSLGKALLTIVLAPFKLIFTIVRFLTDIIGGALTSAFSSLGGVISKIGEVILLPFKPFIELLKFIIRLVSGDVSGAFSGLGDFISSIGEKILGFFSSIFDFDLFESGKKLLSTFTNGIISVITAPFEAVKGGLSKLRNLLPFSDAKEGPLSALTESGKSLMGTLGEGVSKGTSTLLGSTEAAFGKLNEIISAENPWEALKSNVGAGIGTLFGKVKNILPDSLTQDVTPVMGELPALPSVNTETAATVAGSKAAEKGGNKNISIHIASINLPNVQNG
jgi:hypothetical protein